MYTIKYNMLNLKHMLETKTERTYSWAKIAEEAHIHSNTILKMAKNETARVDLDILARLIVFFASVGIELTPNDLLSVTRDTPGEPKNSL
jgi:DNA-binding Xre family transcriptional regulator